MVVHVTSLGPTDQRPGEPFVVKPPSSEMPRGLRFARHSFISVDVKKKRGGQLCKFTVLLDPVFNLGANRFRKLHNSEKVFIKCGWLHLREYVYTYSTANLTSHQSCSTYDTARGPLCGLQRNTCVILYTPVWVRAVEIGF